MRFDIDPPAVSLALSAFAAGQSPTACYMHKQATADDHAIGVDRRGDRSMGFSHESIRSMMERWKKAHK